MPSKPSKSNAGAMASMGAMTRDQAHSQSIRNLTRAAVVMAVALVLCGITSIWALKSAFSQRLAVISVDAKGAVTPAAPLNVGVLPDSRVIGFVEQCLRKAYSHDFLHFDMSVPAAQDCFTAGAGDRYVMAMQSWLKLIQDKRMVMAMVSERPSRVVRLYKSDTNWGEAVTWDIESRISVYLEGKNERVPPQRQLVKLSIVRVPLDVSPSGILISKFLSGPAEGS